MSGSIWIGILLVSVSLGCTGLVPVHAETCAGDWDCSSLDDYCRLIGWTWLCSPRLPLGSDCKGTECQRNAFCLSNAPYQGRTCTLQYSNGHTCDNDSQCQSWYCRGTCGIAPTGGGTSSPGSDTASMNIPMIIILSVSIPLAVCIMIGICCWACYYGVRKPPVTNKQPPKQQPQQQLQMMAMQRGMAAGTSIPTMAKGVPMQQQPQPQPQPQQPVPFPQYYYMMTPSHPQTWKQSLDPSQPYFAYPPQAYLGPGPASNPYQSLQNEPFTHVQVQMEGMVPVPVSASAPALAPTPASAPTQP